ncbi:hypothetical protein AX17_003260 [Amanita inopinata Kibby_2008]|nr:hypothetical protein AX17_003260 [Amanita inopinata Kibby_2008]
MANTLSHITNNRVFSGDGGLTQGNGVSSPSTSISANANASSSDPPKRKRGRPKGSTKKTDGNSPAVPKVKRPVGRPRKDGLPAGSVPKRTPSKRPRVDTNMSDEYPSFPQWGPSSALSGVAYPVASANSSIKYVPEDSKYPMDEWGELANSQPNEFLSSLLSALAAPNPTSSVGPTIEEAFKIHLSWLTTNTSQSHNIPSLYSVLKTFWLPSSPAYFTMAASASNTRMPMEYKFIYWDPQPLVFNGIQCPYCPSSLSNKGRIRSGPVKVYDLEKPFFIIGCEYVCTSPQCVAATTPEGRKFSSIDSSIMNALPKGLKEEFPAHLLYSNTDAGSGTNIWNWSAMGVSKPLWNMVTGGLKLGLKKNTVLQMVHSIQHGAPNFKRDVKEEDRASASVNNGVAADAEENYNPSENANSTSGINNLQNVSDNNGNVAVQNSWNVEETRADSASQPSPSFRPPQNADLMTPSAENLHASHHELRDYTQARRQPPPPRQSPAFSHYPYTQYTYFPDQTANGQSSIAGNGAGQRGSGTSTQLAS